MKVSMCVYDYKVFTYKTFDTLVISKDARGIKYEKD